MGRQAVSALVFLAGLAARLGYGATYATKHYAPFLRYWVLIGVATPSLVPTSLAGAALGRPATSGTSRAGA
jgi:hypothetical protein